MQSLNPTGLPPDSRRSYPMKAICSSGVVLPDKGDANDEVIVVNAAGEVGYEE